MKFKVEWVENKTPEWKVATLSTPDGKREENVSVNKVNKKGEPFPNFEGITPGAEIDGEFWKSESGKAYLFAPKPQPTYKSFQRKPDMNAVMEKKAEHIAHAQDNKEQGIKVSSTIRMATDIAIAEYAANPVFDLKERIHSLREWYWNEWDNTDNFKPF